MLYKLVLRLNVVLVYFFFLNNFLQKKKKKKLFYQHLLFVTFLNVIDLLFSGIFTILLN